MAKLVVTWLASPRERQIPDGTGRSRIEALAVSMASVRSCLVPVVEKDTGYVVFHEDYTEEDKARLRAILPVEFHTVDFSGFDEDFAQAKTFRHKGYLMMCRFMTGVMQQHPALKPYTHYMRLDDDSYFLKPKITKQAVHRMLSVDYAYRQIFWDDKGHDGLYEFTVDFLHQHRLEVPIHGLLQDGKYVGKAIYNNFHVSSLAFWNDPLVVRYIEALEREKAFIRKAWLDANVHTMIVALIAPHVRLEVHQELSFGYKHNMNKALVDSPWEWVSGGDSRFMPLPEEYE